MKDSSIAVVLFDIGGVLVEPSGVTTMLAWMRNRISAEQLWQMWLTSPTVRAFETGRLSVDDFARRVITEFGLPIKTPELLEALPNWSVNFFPGAVELVESILPRYLRATLSNTNCVHWQRLKQCERFERAFSHHFASHLTGKVKPDEDAFRHVIDALGCTADSVLFLDDNELNVRGGSTLGMHAVRVNGVEEAKQALMSFRVLD